MGLEIEGLIENKLNIQEIIELVDILNKKNIGNQANWRWQNKISEQFIIEYWKRDSNWYIKNLGKPEIYDDAIIWGGKIFDIHFCHPKITSIGLNYSWYNFVEFEEERIRINKLLEPLLKVMKVNKVIFTYNLITDINEDEFNKNVQKIDQLESFLKKKNHKFIKRAAVNRVGKGDQK